MPAILEKRFVAALRKRAVTLFARALQKAPRALDKFTSQLSCSLILETRPGWHGVRSAARVMHSFQPNRSALSAICMVLPWRLGRCYGLLISSSSPLRKRTIHVSGNFMKTFIKCNKHVHDHFLGLLG